MTFKEKIKQKWSNGLFVSLGLDPVIEKLPVHISKDTEGVFLFCKDIIDATKDIVAAYKPNSAFFEAFGADGIKALKEVCDYIHDHTDVPIILDAKRGDIGSTNTGYATFVFEYLGADAITVHPWLGSEAAEEFLKYKDKSIIVLCKTSNSGSGQFQNVILEDGTLMYERVAQTVRDSWNKNGNCALVVGATYPEELARVRGTVGDDMPILVPGIGAQGGDLEATLQAGFSSSKEGVLINSSRGIIYASSGKDFAEAARMEVEKLNTSIARVWDSIQV